LLVEERSNVIRLSNLRQSEVREAVRRVKAILV